MDRLVHSKAIKKAAKAIIMKHYIRLTTDFETNKRVCDEVAVSNSLVSMRNQIAHYVTLYMNRLLERPVRGISDQLIWERAHAAHRRRERRIRERRERRARERRGRERRGRENDADALADMLKVLDMEDSPDAMEM